MSGWKDNPIMEWSVDGEVWNKISDHGRDPLDINTERIENKHRLANGTLRRYVVAKKRTIQISWSNLPNNDDSGDFLANGEDGDWMQGFHDDNDGAFYVRLRKGSDVDIAVEDEDEIETLTMMITEFSKAITKRGPSCDLWDLDITLDEV